MTTLIKPVTLADLSPGDISQLEALRLDGCGPRSNMTLWLQNPDPEGRIVLALNEGAIVGWALCSQYKGTGCSPDDPLTLNVFVCPDFRRRGIGRALFDSLNFEARGASMWTGFHDEPSFKFWRAMASRFWPMADICGDFRSSGRH